jgi:Metallopeptidase family M81
MDALLLALHGAMSTEEHPSGDAEIARRMRESVGPDLPIVVSHDFHANVLPGLLRNVDGVAGYRAYPHIDQRDTGRRASDILARIFVGAKTVNWRVPIPMLISPQFSSTFEQPLVGVMDEMAGAFPDDEGSATLFCVQLQNKRNSLVAIIGPGGTGKTALCGLVSSGSHFSRAFNMPNPVAQVKMSQNVAKCQCWRENDCRGSGLSLSGSSGYKLIKIPVSVYD